MALLAPAQPIVVRAVGACSPLGMDSRALAATVLAGSVEPRSTPWANARGERWGMVHCRFLRADLVGAARLRALAVPALRELAAGAEPPLPLLIALADPSRPPEQEPLGASLLADLGRASTIAVDETASACWQGGNASIGRALERAFELVELEQRDVIVGAVDSFYGPRSLGWLDEQYRLHGPGVEDGFIPAEGAAFLRLGPARDRSSSGREGGEPSRADSGPPLARVRSVGYGLERHDLLVGAPLLARTLSALVGQAVDELGRAVRWVASDANGERHRTREWSRVEVRHAEALGGARHDRFGHSFGDPGAAGAALTCALACRLWQWGAAPADTLLVAAGSDGPERAVVVLEALGSRPGASAACGELLGVGPSQALPPLGADTASTPARGGALVTESVPGWTKEGIEEHLRSASRHYLSELAALSGLRVPLEQQDWRDAEPFEGRLAAAARALWALAPPAWHAPTPRWGLLEEIDRYASEMPIADRGRAFARALLRGSLCDRAGVERAVTGLADVDAPAPIRQAIGDALALAPSPHVAPLLEALFEATSAPAARAAALDVLRRRRAVPCELAERALAQPDPIVSRAAARALGVAVPNAAARAALGAAATTRPELALELAESLLEQTDPLGLELARGELDRTLSSGAPAVATSGPLRLVALAGDATDLDRIARSVGSTPHGVRLGGLYGHVALVPTLLALLERCQGPGHVAAPCHRVALEAVRALERITGAGLSAAPDLDQEPALDVEPWRLFWRREHASFAPSRRYRWGRPYEPLTTIEELRGASRAVDRRDLAFELGVVAGPLGLETDDWVGRQRATLDAVAATWVPPQRQPPAGAFAADWLVWRARPHGDL